MTRKPTTTPTAKRLTPSSVKRSAYFFSLLVAMAFVAGALIFSAVFADPSGASQDRFTMIGSWGAFTIITALAAGVWRRLTFLGGNGPARPSLFSARGALLGGTGAFLILWADSLYGTYQSNQGVYPYIPVSTWLPGLIVFTALGSLIIAFIPGALIGGLTRSIFWWVNTLPPRGMEVIGIVLILCTFALQALQPLVILLGIAIT
jgi:hypothetical protein